jgi:16S rRNA A1518/A1519 N6-dimethyltransferase RsmA/KsgA/DIM1 with predicted DNA glycosylase/AP lyase activity
LNKRKTLANTRSGLYPKEKIIDVLKKLQIKEKKRAEELSLENLIVLFTTFTQV